MALSAGTVFGAYEILAPIGAGGMGEVYRAKDKRLHREVAFKILSGDHLENSERQRRFVQEARAASALNHPNILSVYDVGSQNGIQYIVSELVDGDSLRKLIQKGPVPTKKLLDVAVQIADGLAAAHQAGIVHRDLKPENIMLTRDGRVKILDFGLAKPLTPKFGGPESQTASTPITESGIIVGTVKYMSPEQASGQDTDFRSDQFSIGLILYEMATGKQAFQRNTPIQILSAIVSEEPPSISTLNPNVPAPVRWLIDRCLQKDPGNRYASTTDLYHESRNLRDHLTETVTTEQINQPVKRMRVKAAVILSLAVATLFGLFAGQFMRETPSPSAPNFKLLTFGKGSIKKARFTADGNTIIYSAAWSGNPLGIYSTRIESTESIPISLPNSDLLSVSSKGELAIMLLPQSTLARAPISGGTPRKIVEAALDADWAPDGINMAIHGQGGGIDRIEYPVGKVIYKAMGNIKLTRVSPDGMNVAFAYRPGLQPPDVLEIIDRAGKKKKTYKGDEWLAIWGLAWHPSGKEVWVKTVEEGGSGFYAVPLEGEPRLVMKLDGYVGLADISRNGDLLINRGHGRVETWGLAPGESRERNFSWLDGSTCFGTAENGNVLFFNEVRLGSRKNSKIYMRRTDDSPPVRLGDGLGCSVSQDGNWVLAVNQDAPNKLVLLPTGAGEIKSIDTSPVKDLHTCALSPDAKQILTYGIEEGHNWQAYLVDLNGGKPRALAPGSFFTIGASAVYPFSPDGNFVSAANDDDGWQIFSTHTGEAQPLRGMEGNEIVLRWSKDSKSVFVSNLELPAKVYQVDPITGRRELKHEIRPADPAGVEELFSLLLSEDPKSYYYSFQRGLTDLYLVSGVK